MRILSLLLLVSSGLSSYAQDYNNLTAYLKKVETLRLSNCDSALLLVEKLDLSHPKVTAELEAKIILEIAVSHYCLGNYDQALSNYQKALEKFKTFGNRTQESNILNLIGTLQKKQGHLQKALDYFQKGLATSTQSNDTIGIGNSLNNIGLVHLELEQFEKALEYFLHSTQVKESVRDTVGLSYNFDNLGMTYSQLKDFDNSLRYFLLAGEYKKMIGDEVGYAIVQNNIGEMLLELGRANEAESYFNVALEVASKANYADFKQHILSMLSTTWERKGDLKKSLSFHKQHVTLKDSLFNERKSQQIAELETKYQSEKNKRELEAQAAKLAQNQILLSSAAGIIVLLLFIGFQGRNRMKWKHGKLLEEQKRRAREAEMNAVISSQEKERNRFARDLHDGFGQLISTLNLNLKNLETPKNKNDREKVFHSSAKVLDEMYQELKNVCFNLMPQTLIKMGLDSAINEFADRINVNGQKHIEVNVFGLKERMTELQEISLYRITQEWVNNILKYSDADRITIQVTKDESELTLLIEDNGMGFDPLLLTSGKGLGWKNMTSRSNLINGELELDTTPGLKGNTLIINASLVSELEIVQNTF